MKYYIKENLFVKTIYSENDQIQTIDKDGNITDDINIELVEYKPLTKILGAVLFSSMIILSVCLICALKND